MAAFNDVAGRSWELQLDALAIQAVRSEVDPDFLKGPAQETFARLLNDPALLCLTIYVLCRRQMQARDISQEDFMMGVVGQAIADATEALVVAIMGFIPPSERALPEAMLKKQKLLTELGTGKTLEKLDDPQFVDRFLAALDQEMEARIGKLTRGSTSSPSATATPASSPSVLAD